MMIGWMRYLLPLIPMWMGIGIFVYVRELIELQMEVI